jgi:hypothetical protein
MTIPLAGVKLTRMEAEIERMQQPVRKVAGRPLTLSRRLANPED